MNDKDKPVELNDIKKYIKDNDVKCEWCGNSFDPNNVDTYHHSHGYAVVGIDRKQWIYITCKNCDYDWAL